MTPPLLHSLAARSGWPGSPQVGRGLDLHQIRHDGLDIDACFACGGVFLDKGELEHIATKEETKGVMNAILNWFTPETKR